MHRKCSLETAPPTNGEGEKAQSDLAAEWGDEKEDSFLMDQLFVHGFEATTIL